MGKPRASAAADSGAIAVRILEHRRRFIATRSRASLSQQTNRTGPNDCAAGSRRPNRALLKGQPAFEFKAHYR